MAMVSVGGHGAVVGGGGVALLAQRVLDEARRVLRIAKEDEARVRVTSLRVAEEDEAAEARLAAFVRCTEQLEHR
eukprot:scaffold108137_cov51-Phaeocystis_antarctica.AAC.2